MSLLAALYLVMGTPGLTQAGAVDNDAHDAIPTPLIAPNPPPSPFAGLRPAGVPADHNLIVYRERAEPTAWAPTVKVDGVKMVAISNKRYSSLRVSTGTHRVTLSWPVISGQRNAEMQLIVGDDTVHFIEVTGISRYAGGGGGMMYFTMGSGIAEARPEFALGTIAKCCRYKPAKLVAPN